MTAVKSFATVTIAALFAGCSGAASVEEGMFFPTWGADGAVPAAIVQGELVENDDCLFLKNDGERTLVAWEDGMGFEDGALLDVGGAPIAQVGETIHGGGGYYGNLDHFESTSGEAVPERCVPPGGDVPDGDRFAIIYDVQAGPFE